VRRIDLRRRFVLLYNDMGQRLRRRSDLDLRRALRDLSRRLHHRCPAVDYMQHMRRVDLRCRFVLLQEFVGQHLRRRSDLDLRYQLPAYCLHFSGGMQPVRIEVLQH
jgi:hypothetical protein